MLLQVSHDASEFSVSILNFGCFHTRGLFSQHISWRTHQLPSTSNNDGKCSCCNGKKTSMPLGETRRERVELKRSNFVFVIALSNIHQLHLDLKTYCGNKQTHHFQVDHFEQTLASPFKRRLQAFAFAFATSSSVTSRRSRRVFGALVLSRRPRLNSLITLSICAWISLRALKNPSAGL